MFRAVAVDDQTEGNGMAETMTRCGAFARRGTGTGTCERPLDEHGQCDRAGQHLDHNLMQMCADLLPGHQHCPHGHTRDCPDEGSCVVD